MVVGIPRERKDHEGRVGLTTAGASALVRGGCPVLLEQDAGIVAGFAPEAYAAAGAELVPNAADVWGRAGLIVKVKGPLPNEFAYLRPGLALFTFLHLVALPELTRQLIARQVTAIGYETVRLPDGRLPLLEPMSDIAGRLATQVGAHFLQTPNGGRGVLLGGAPGAPPAHVVVIGAGRSGTAAIEVAHGMGAQVTAIDRDPGVLASLAERFRRRLTTAISTPETIAGAVASADLLITAVLVAGARAPVIVTAAMVATMPRGSVIVDVAVDQGGAVETSRPTTHSDPVFVTHGVIHYGVTNTA